MSMENAITVERNSTSPFERLLVVIALLLTALLFVHIGGYGMLLGVEEGAGNVSVIDTTTEFPTPAVALLALEALGDEPLDLLEMATNLEQELTTLEPELQQSESNSTCYLLQNPSTMVHSSNYKRSTKTVQYRNRDVAFAVGWDLDIYQTEFRWNVLLTISFTVGGLIVCFIFQIVALCFIVIWYRYIDYMNGGDESCVCTSSIVECIKGQRKNRGRAAATDYSIPEAPDTPTCPT
uniref:Uncharacterized protein n=1 Tax=Ditylenchus dipsaci TaxID=166011 RepID=A0A915ERE8_9BILA